MKRHSLILKRLLYQLSPSRLLSSSLLGILLIIYIYTVYAIVVTLGTFPFGKQPELNLLPTMNQWQLNSIALLCLALTIIPVGRWLHIHVNDLVYAQYDNPYALPVEVNQQLHRMNSIQLTMPHVVETIGKRLHLPYIVLIVDGKSHLTYEFGVKPEGVTPDHIPVCYLDQQLGKLLVSNRLSNRSLNHTDFSILQECAQRIGIALYVVKITGDLQASRERIIIAREEERRRIRNDLHDGLAPTLSSFQLQLGAIRKLIIQDPALSEAMIQELSDDLRLATADIRRLVYDLRPPMLDELGLIAAIKNLRLSDSAIQLNVITPESMPPLSAATEVAIYRIVTEAVHNVVKHADATTCTVNIAVEPEILFLSVTDDGKGFADSDSSGIGFQSMQERAAELGGTFSIEPGADLGTRIDVRLPLGG